jgi:hypothetical protein
MTDTQVLAITVGVIIPPLSVTTASLAGGTVGTAYSQTLAASGGAGAGTYTWSLANGTSLPAGLALSAARSAARNRGHHEPHGTGAGGLTATKDLSIAIA